MICQALESVFAAWKRRNVSTDAESLDPLHRAVKAIEKLLTTSEDSGSALDRDELFRLQEKLASLEVARPPRRGEDRSGRSAQTGSAEQTPASADERAEHLTIEPGDAAPAGSPQSSPAIPQAIPDQPPATVAPAATPATPPGDRSLPARSTPPSATLRISAAKLDALLLQAEELLSLKLNANQRGSDLQGIATTFAEWDKQWIALTSDVQTLRQLVTTGGAQKSGAASNADACLVPATLAVRLLEFLEWNLSFVQSAENHVRDFAKLADRHRHNTASRVDGLLDEAKRLLMLPFSTLLAVFPRLVRELSRDMEKDVELRIVGAEIEIDKRILDDLKDPLIHLLRNSIDHGIEKPEQRILRGKAGARHR